MHVTSSSSNWNQVITHKLIFEMFRQEIEKKIKKLFVGEMVTFDNLRILHGRTAFGENLKGERHVQGAYLDWDEARSRIRVLKTKLLGN